MDILHFAVLNVRLCMELKYVHKLVLLPQLDIVPGGARELAGLLNLNGRSIPIVDIGLYLGLNRTQSYSLDTPIIVCEDGNDVIGMIVDKILGLTVVTKEASKLDKRFNVNDSLFSGVVMVNEELALMLNSKRLFSADLLTGNTSNSVNKELINSVMVTHNG